MSSGPNLPLIVAHNLRVFMARSANLKNANTLGKAAGVSPNTVRNLLEPAKRTVTADKPSGYPILDTLDVIAQKLGCEVWELLHPDIERSLREREMYKQIEDDFLRRVKTDSAKAKI